MTAASSHGGKKMWVMPDLTPEFIERMEEVLDLYAKPYDPKEPVLCFDEKSKELRKDARPVIRDRITKRDYEYVRNGTANVFMTVEPKAGYRTTHATKRRRKQNFARETRRISKLPRYRKAKRIHIVLDNLNTHGKHSLVETFGIQESKQIMRRIEFHHTPKHASWLNMAEIELSILGRQALNQRIPDRSALRAHLKAWETRRNAQKKQIQWRFTKQDARRIFKYD